MYTNESVAAIARTAGVLVESSSAVIGGNIFINPVRPEMMKGDETKRIKNEFMFRVLVDNNDLYAGKYCRNSPDEYDTHLPICPSWNILTMNSMHA